MKRAVVAILAAVGGLMILGILFILAMSWAFLSPTPLPSHVVLELDLDRGLVEAVPQDPFLMALERRRLTTRDLVEGLERAAQDRRVVGLLVRGSGGVGGWARTEEVRDAVLRFRESGKPAVYFSETFGEFGPGQGSYYLASAFDEILLQPSGDVGLMPLTAEMPFFAEALDKLDIEPRFEARREYKDAGEIFTRTGFSEPSREAVQALLESILGSLTAAVAQARSLPEDSVRTLVAGGPYMAHEAEAAGLVDRLAYLDEARSRVLELADGEAERLALRSYLDRDGRAWNRGTRVALIYGVGVVQRGESGYEPFTGGVSFGATSVAGHVRQAVEDPGVRAILFRVDSPGGSYVASDLVRRELARAREAGKPVVISMGNVAASGGYLVAVDADRIVAQPSTITGSIGVLAGKLVTEEFWARMGIHWDRVQVGGETTMFSGVDDFSPEEWERLQAMLDRIYDEFVEYVADGRGMSVGAVEEVARGRVWSGRDAMERGLVDELGGFHAAIGQVRDLLDLAEDAPIHLIQVPRERTLFQLLMEDGFWATVAARSGRGAGGAVEGALAGALLQRLEPLLSRAAAAGLLGELPGPTRMPWLEVPSP